MVFLHIWVRIFGRRLCICKGLRRRVFWHSLWYTKPKNILGQSFCSIYEVIL